MTLAELISSPALPRALVVGAFGGAGLVLTTIYSRRGPLIFPVYATLLAGLALLLARYEDVSFAARFAAALAGFLAGSAAHYVAVGVLAARQRERLRLEGRLPPGGGVPLLGHLWRVGSSWRSAPSWAPAWRSSPGRRAFAAGPGRRIPPARAVPGAAAPPRATTPITPRPLGRSADLRRPRARPPFFRSHLRRGTMRTTLRSACAVGAVLVVCGCVARPPVRTAPVAATTHADSVRIAARVVRSLLADSALYAEVRQAMARTDRPAAEHPRVDSSLYDDVRAAIARLNREAATKPRTDSLLDRDLLALKARLDTLLLQVGRSPRTYVDLRIF